MIRTWLLHTKNGNMIINENEAIQNAKDQEKKGIEPKFYWMNWKEDKKEGPAGWLVWSTFEDGAGVVFKNKNGCYYVVTGWQADFCYN